MNKNKLILNYQNVCLYESDVEILRTPKSWLNDSCIYFRFTQLSEQAALINSCKCKFMDPSILSFIMHQCDDDDFLDLYSSMSLHEYKHLFIPVNDSMNVETDTWKRQGGGSHYSLLFVTILPTKMMEETTDLKTFDKSSNSCNHHSKKKSRFLFFHFDSHQGANENVSYMVAQKILKLLTLNDENVYSISTRDGTAVLSQCLTPQQLNYYDCGIYLLKISEILALSPYIMSYDIDSNRHEFQRTCEEVVQTSIVKTSPKHDFANQLRHQMTNEIELLSKKYLLNGKKV